MFMSYVFYSSIILNLDLMKHTERADPEYADLDISLKMLTGLTVAMDHVQQMSR